MRIRTVALAVVLAAAAVPAAAQINAPSSAQAPATTAEQMLQQELDAERAINAQLRARVQQLEDMLNGTPPSPPALQPLQGTASGPQEEAVNTTAIREALISKGLLVLPSGSFRLFPGVGWVHSGSGLDNTRNDAEVGSLGASVGLPLDSMFSISAAYINRSTSLGSNSGWGDISAGIVKQLGVETEDTPSLLLGAAYTHNTGKDPFSSVPIGAGYPSVTGTLLAMKAVEPVVGYANLSYSYGFSRQVTAANLFGQPEFMGRIAPGASYGYRVGASLVVTPTVSFDGSLSGSFNERSLATTTTGTAITVPATTLVFLNFGGGFLLSRNASLLLGVSAGVTRDTPNFAFSATVPISF